jgi:hypothetical protein
VDRCIRFAFVSYYGVPTLSGSIDLEAAKSSGDRRVLNFAKKTTMPQVQILCVTAIHLTEGVPTSDQAHVIYSARGLSPSITDGILSSGAQAIPSSIVVQSKTRKLSLNCDNHLAITTTEWPEGIAASTAPKISAFGAVNVQPQIHGVTNGGACQQC